MSIEPDVYFELGYTELYARTGDKAHRFAFQAQGESFELTYLLRPVESRGKRWFDGETAYGYGGPVTTTSDPAFLALAWDAAVTDARSQGVVSLFLRFHPLLENWKGLPQRSELSLFRDRATVAIDLRPSETEMWELEIHPKHRNVIRKARENRVTVEMDESFRTLEEFTALYRLTMDRLGATDDYYFSDDYFNRFARLFSGRSCIVGARHEGQLVAAALLFWGPRWGHYHLSGSDPERLNLYPNNLMLWESALYLKAKGAESFHLGGGTSADPENSLFKFKQRFSRAAHEFWLGKVIINPEVYADLRADWEQRFPEKVERYGRLLQCYRY